ncbi:hypothetical protein QFZ75_008114 [Streptomyces sp. V3I8]|uniref:hypothetical protein n=1 Tax=Streptomyces sp. V3I8 TaxID=3042279 RepID=UPI0027887E24|nr:hypothetical protein [Streptomyces sp. V3I8]MDQ1041612.1 hypothetical protein [Streptomyces sp. V3I8]
MHNAHGQKERQDARDELTARVWLNADVSRRLRAIAARTGLQPEQVLAQLADRVRMDDTGALTVDTFTPSGEPVHEPVSQ